MEESGGCDQVEAVASVTCSELSTRSGTSLEVGSWSGAHNVLEQWVSNDREGSKSASVWEIFLGEGSGPSWKLSCPTLLSIGTGPS